MELYFLEYLPLILVGFIVGTFKGLKLETHRKDDKITSHLQIAKSVFLEGLAGSIICFIAYGLLSIADLPYIFKCCVGACIVFLGMDKALEIVDKFLRIRK